MAVQQQFSMPMGDTTYNFRLTWCVPSACWLLDIADASNSLMVGGIPLVTGADLLAQYRYLGFVGSLVVQTDNNPDAVPTYDNLGTTGHLYYVPAP